VLMIFVCYDHGLCFCVWCFVSCSLWGNICCFDFYVSICSAFFVLLLGVVFFVVIFVYLSRLWVAVCARGVSLCHVFFVFVE
jgi:hypothetical protein